MPPLTELGYPLRGHAPRSGPVKRVVVHAMAEFVLTANERGGPRVEYCAAVLERLGLSAHAIILPDGRVLRCVDDSRMAWHAKGHNKDSLGVEIALAGVHTYGQFVARIAHPWPTNAQYEAAHELLLRWLATYPNLTVTTHAALDSPRKVDPGSGCDMMRVVGGRQELLVPELRR